MTIPAFSPPLLMGQSLGLPGSTPPTNPVNLAWENLKGHTAILAQSGSGKSFALGRLIEEIASKSYARFIILDPNSDFIRISEINERAWTDYAESVLPNDSKEEFTQRWGKIRFTVLTNRTKSAISLSKKAKCTPIFLRWGALELLEKMKYLGFSTTEHPEEVRVVHLASDIARSNWRDWEENGARFTTYSIRHFLKALELLRKIQSAQSLENFNLKLPTDFNHTGVSQFAIERVYARTNELWTFRIWATEKGGRYIDAHVESIVRNKTKTRVLVVDLPSLDKREEQFQICNAVLKALWQASEKKWAEAISKPISEDKRWPVFLVIDEAHNLAPAEPKGRRAYTVTESLVRIAAEGRKYGIFLIVTSQRPSQVNPNILAECDNLILMKTNNRFDLEMVEKTFGFLQVGLANQAHLFDIGHALLSGRFVNGKSVYARISIRRTAQGGRNIGNDWIQDPLKND